MSLQHTDANEELKVNKHEEAQYYALLAFQLREEATDMLEEAQRLTKLSKELIREHVAS
jgi:hypothetical protein